MASQAEIRRTLEIYEDHPDSFITNSIYNTAAAIVETSADVQPGQKVLIWFDVPGAQLAKAMNNRCLARGAETSYFMRDFEEDARVIQNMSLEEIDRHFDEEERFMNEAEVVLIVRGPENPEAMNQVPFELRSAYTKRYGKVHERRSNGSVDWTLFLWPTEYEAKKEGLPFDEYFRLYMEACNQPWEAIKIAQEKLIEKLDGASRLELIANEDDPDPNKRTRVSMSIKGMTFANSTIDKNYPGSEVFSAPVIDSVNGQIYADGEYLYDGFLMKNILLRIKNGKIIEATAEAGNEYLQEILSQGEGARYFGEVALGTNRGLTRRFFNDLLNEKVGGSFHMALGRCYTYKTYGGKEVHLNNGNTEDKTPNHWDLTILMHKGGRVVVDGEIIQKNGKFLDPELEILNPKFN